MTIEIPNENIESEDIDNGANLAGLDFSNAKITKQTLENINFSESNLSDANLSGNGFINIDFSRAKLVDAYLRKGFFYGVDFSEADLKNCEIDVLHGNDLNFTRADLSNADLSGGHLDGSVFPDANLRNADLRGALLQKADFSEAILQRADLSKTDLRDTNLTNADLTGADLSGADITGAHLTGADLSNANMNNATISIRGLYKAKVDDSVRREILFRKVSLAVSKGTTVLLAVVSTIAVIDGIAGGIIRQLLSFPSSTVFRRVTSLIGSAVPVLTKPSVIIGLAGLVVAVYNMRRKKDSTILNSIEELTNDVQAVQDELADLNDEIRSSDE